MAEHDQVKEQLVAAHRARLALLDQEEQRLRRERYEIVLTIEEAEGRGEGHEARFARALLAGQLDVLDRLCAEGDAEYFRRWGHWPQQHIREQAAQLVAGAPTEAANG